MVKTNALLQKLRHPAHNTPAQMSSRINVTKLCPRAGATQLHAGTPRRTASSSSYTSIPGDVDVKETQAQPAQPKVNLEGACEVFVQKLQSTGWVDMGLVLTLDVIAFVEAGGVAKGYDDVIPLVDIDRVELIPDEDVPGSGGGSWSPSRCACKIFTVGWQGKPAYNSNLKPDVVDGYNLGRKYCISMDPDAQLREAKVGGGMGLIEKLVVDGKFHSLRDFVKTLSELVRRAKRRRQGESLFTQFGRSRLVVRALFAWTPFQTTVGMLLAANFAMSAMEAQAGDNLTLEDGSPSQIAKTLAFSDNFFISIFTIELVLNLYAHWMRDFISDPWCCFDFVVVLMGILTPFLQDSPMPVTIFRLFRVFRILRFFGRLKSLKKIIIALSASLAPVANSFLIMFIILSIYAIIGVSFFAEKAPDAFGKFDRAFATLFRIAAGDSWIDGMDVLDKESGQVDWGTGAFVFSFILVVNWTLLQVSVAVLLDNFVSETERGKEREQAIIREIKMIQDSIGNVLDPMLFLLAREYIDQDSLCCTLAEIFQRLLKSEGAHDELTCENIINGFAKLGVTFDESGDTRGLATCQIYMTKMDFDTITEHGAFANANGALGAAEFVQVMRKQVTYFIKRRLHRVITETATQQDFASLATLKSLLAEVDSMKEEMNSCFRRNESSFHDVHDAIASLTASVNNIGEQLRKSGGAGPSAGVVPGGAETMASSISSLSAQLTASVNKLGQQFSPSIPCDSGGENLLRHLPGDESSGWPAEKHQQLPFMSEWEQRNRTSCQAAPDTNVSLTSIQVTVPAEAEDCAKHETTPILLEPRTMSRTNRQNARSPKSPQTRDARSQSLSQSPASSSTPTAKRFS